MSVSCDISWFNERDIDLWLTEELRVNQIFAEWFVRRIEFPEGVLVPAMRTQPSVVDETGETDVEAVFNSQDGRKFAALIENKITASFQDDQMARYLRRGELGVLSGKWHEFAAVVFTPRQYSMLGMPSGVRSILFEEAAEFLRASARELRTIYRAIFLEQAGKGKIMPIEDAEPFRREWWHAVDEMVRREFGNFFVVDRRTFPKTTYINPRCQGMPSYVRIDLKGQLGQVDLSFKNIPLQALRDCLAGIKSTGAKVIQNSKSAALRVDNLQPFLISDGLGVIETSVKEAYVAAYNLLAFWDRNKLAFDKMLTRLRLRPTSHV